MRTQNINLKEFLSSMGVSVPLHIPEVPDIPPFTKFSRLSRYKVSAPPTYKHLHNNATIKNESTTNIVSTKKNLVDILKTVNSCYIFVRNKHLHIFV